MPALTCKHCGKNFDAVAETTACPHCQKNVAAEVMATMRPDNPVPEISKSMTEDTAQTANAGTMQVPDPSLQLVIGESSRTLKSAGESPNIGDFMSTLKPTDSVLESVDLSSAIPPRGIATDDKPGEAKDYRLGKKLGSGAFGVVYQAEQIALQRSVALKMLKPRKRLEDDQTDDTKARIKSQRVKDRNEFLREAQFTGKLEHPNIVPVHDIGLVTTKSGTGNRPFYVMKEIKGQSWQSKIKQNERTENLEILRRVAEAIGYAHDKKILHCDLKPENIMLGEFGEVLVVDWGQAVDTSRPETLRPGGSPAYISPEMAKFWCDMYLDNKSSSLAVKDVGPQTDVYLLGAILFEIITGRPPHFGLKGETSHDVMRRAIENQISNHDDWMDDELMTIARHALRLDTSVSYDTVSEFQEALKQYETRRISIELRDRALDLLDEAKANNDYDAYGKARFGFEESLEKWDGNDISKTGLSDARLSCAELALKDQNFDLGIGMLEDPETDQEVTLRKKLVGEKSKRDRRKKLIGFLSIGLVLAGLASIGLIGVAGKSMNDARKASDDAIDAKIEAKKERDLASEAKVEALKAGKLAETAKERAAEAEAKRIKAVAAQSKLNEQNSELAGKIEKREGEFKKREGVLQANIKKQGAIAEQKKKEAAEALKSANLAKAEAQKALQAEAEAKARNVLLKFKDSVSQIESPVRDGDYATATARLNSIDEDQRFVEWGRLKMLTHPASTKILKPDSSIETASASLDGKRIAVVSGDKIVIRDSEDFDNVLQEFTLPGVTAVALSADGQSLAGGVPGDAGKIVLFQKGEKIVLNRAPSKKITDLKFSEDGNRLLCVGQVDRARKATGAEEELMVYERGNGSWNRLDVKLTMGRQVEAGQKAIPNAGRQPNVTNAVFSKDGNRILLSTNTGDKTESGETQRKSIHVYDLDNSQYRWKDTAESNGVDVAIFANDAGTQVAGCVTDDDGSSLFVWNPQSSPQGQTFISTTGNSIEKIRPLDGRIRSMSRISRDNGENYILTAGEDRKVSLWNWANRSLVGAYQGHSNTINFCTLVQNGVSTDKSKLVSIVYGDKPEVLNTDLAKFVKDKDTLVLGDQKNKTMSPASLFVSRDRKFAVVGHDNGHATFKKMLSEESGLPGESIEWDVSAWKRHVLTNEFLFAQSSNDEFLQFDRKTGALKGVLRMIGQQNSGTEIEKFQVSDDGKTALVETNSQQLEFQIWDLVNQVRTSTINYSTVTTNKLPFVKLSADGKYVVAGKIGFAVWSTDSGMGSSPIFNRFGGGRAITLPKNPINNVVFYPNEAGECEFAISWPEEKGSRTGRVDENRPSGRIHLYSKSGQTIQPIGRFRVAVTDGAFDPGIRSRIPNIFGGRLIGGKRYILVRTSKSIDLLMLRPDVPDPNFEGNDWAASDMIANFKDAKHVRFSDKNDDVLILNKPNREVSPVQRWNKVDGVKNLNLVENVKQDFPEFPRDNIDAIQENAEGIITIQTLVRSKTNKSRKVYNTLSLNENFSISALRVMANPTVKYAAIAKDKIVTLDCGTIRKWKMVPNSNGIQQASKLIVPDGVLEGFYEHCQVSPDGNQLLVTQRGSGLILVIDSETGNLIYDIEEASLDANIKPTAVTWSEDGSQFAIGFGDGAIKVFEVADGKASLLALQPTSAIGGPIKRLTFKNDNKSLLAVMKNKEENNVNYAAVYRKMKTTKKNDEGDEVSGPEKWDSVIIGFPAADTIAAAHLSSDGERVVTGSDSGRLTLWNTSPHKVVVEQHDFESESFKEQVKQRELLELSKYSSEVRFVQFFNKPDNGDLVDIISADKGGVNETVNEMEIWNTAR